MSGCRELHFTGSVQGVGFRWTAKRLADRIGLSGWVRNNPDGSVTLVARGGEADMDELVAGLDSAFGPYIRKMESRDRAAGSVPDGFEIVR